MDRSITQIIRHRFYMKNKQAFSKKKFLLYAIMIFLPLVVCSVAYMSYAAYQTIDFYQSIKTKERGWEGNVHVADAELGFSPVPNSYGTHLFPMGPDIPMRYDEDGFRVPVEKIEGSSKHPRPLVLALGCSVTYGDASYAKDTYPYLVGKSLKGTSKNAGVCSYGLSQMLLLAKKLLPIHKPDYLLVQYSPWLVSRAQDPFAPSSYGKVPTPFFYDIGDNFALNSPVFLAKVMELPIDRYRHGERGVMDALSFYWNVGLPLFFHDDFNMLKYYISRSIGILPNPTKRREDLVEYVYGEIYNEAKEHGAKLVIVVLGAAAKPVVVKDLSFPSDAILVHAHDALLNYLTSVNNIDYMRAYAHWRGSPRRLVDIHPNKFAHRIIARAIVSTIAQAEMETSN